LLAMDVNDNALNLTRPRRSRDLREQARSYSDDCYRIRKDACQQKPFLYL